MDDVEKKDRAERYKLSFDLLKHLTTLSSGSVILILTLADRLSKTTASWLFMVCSCMFLFGYCVRYASYGDSCC